MVDWGLLIIALLCAVALTWIVRRLAYRKQLLDIPVGRSAHDTPTPVGGGLAIVIPFYILGSYYLVQGEIPANEFYALLGGILIAALGLADDYRHLDISWRLSGQVAAALWTVWWLGDSAVIAIGSWNLDFPVLVHVLSVLALIWLMNLYNFMDGIDGLAGSEAVFVTLVSCLIVINSGDRAATVISALICALTLGFLFWNWPPARIFMGDVGSSFLGYILGLLALVTMQHGSMNLWAWLLLLGVFVIDATLTLFWRFASGQKLFQGHDIHAYQHAARRYSSHRKVTLVVMLINLLWLAPLAWFAVLYPQLGVLLALLGLIPLLILANYFNAGRQAKVEPESA